MDELIKITNHNQIETVNARELHEFLDIGRDFSTWIKQRIERYSFLENYDYIKISQSPESGSGNRGATIDYFISTDMAKELSMVENNDRGKLARQYFINREKQAKELEKKNQLPDFTNPAESARAWADQFEKREAAEYKVTLMRPEYNLGKAAVRNVETQYSITDAGKHLGLHQKEIFTILRSHKLLTAKDLPTQKAIDENILQLRSNPDSNGKNWPQAVMNMENMKNFNEKYNKFELKGEF